MSGRYPRERCSVGRFWRNTMKRIKLTANRIIGLICLITGVILSMVSLGATSVILAFAGLAIFIGGSDKHFVALRAFKLKKFGYIVLFDAVFWLVTVGAAWLMGRVLNARAEALKLQIDPTSIAANAAAQSSLMKNFFVLMVVLVIVYIVVELIAYTFFRGLIWLTILNKKPPKKFFVRFFGANTVWWLIWFLPALFILGGLKQEFTMIAFPILFVLYLHLTTLFHYTYVVTKSFKKAIKTAFSTGFGSIHKFIVPYSFVFLMYFVLLHLYLFLPQEGIESFIATLIFVILYLAWYRLYIAEILKQLRI